MARTISSPGVEINEIDQSQNASLPVGTNVLVHGFAAAGPTNELLNVTTTSEFEQIYGAPTNAAERYFASTARQVLQSPGNLITSRLPYGSGSGAGFGTDITALLFPISAAEAASTGLSANTTVSAEDGFSQLYSTVGNNVTGDGFIIGEPTHVTITEATLNEWEAGVITWSTSAGQDVSLTNPGNAAFIIVNDSRTSINERGEGYYVALSDPIEADTINSQQHDAVLDVKTLNAAATTSTYQTLDTANLTFSLSSAQGTDSLSEDIELINANLEQPEFDDEIIISLVRLRSSITNASQNILDRVSVGNYSGSFDVTKTDSTTNGIQSSFIAGKINDNSSHLKMFVNTNFARAAWETNGLRIQKDGPGIAGGLQGPLSTGNGATGVLNHGAKSLFPMGGYLPINLTLSNKTIGNLPTKLDNALVLSENIDEVPIDIVVDGGLSTIYTMATGSSGDANANNYGSYDDEGNFSQIITDLSNANSALGRASDPAQKWKTIYNTFQTFCETTRKDCMFIADPLRHIFVQGENAKTIDDPNKTFSANILRPVRNLVDTSSSNFTATYANWGRAFDTASGKFVWNPMSGYIANVMARLDRNRQPWFAPAGLNNGLLQNLTDIALNPNQKQRDILYRNSINPVVFFPGDGFVVFGQKTLQKKPSAFDRINVRRLFLTLEKATLAITRFFVFEPNTPFTRTRLVNTLKPIMQVAKDNEGVTDFLIVADERNNTPDVIDNNELKVDIYIKPVHAAEFILVNFIATRTGQDFEELI